MNKIDKEFDEKFVEEAFGEKFIKTVEGKPEAIKSFYNSKIKELLTELAGEEIKIPIGEQTIGRNAEARALNSKRQEIINLLKQYD